MVKMLNLNFKCYETFFNYRVTNLCRSMVAEACESTMDQAAQVTIRG